MNVSTYNPADYVNNNVNSDADSNVNSKVNSDNHAANASNVANNSSISNGDDIVRMMPTLTDLQKPHSDQEFIERAMSEERSNHKNLIASSRDELPSVLVNGVMIDRTAIAQEQKTKKTLYS